MDVLVDGVTGGQERVASTMALPALERHVERYPCPPARVILITHLLDTAVPFVEAMARGADVAAVVGIPYSSTPSAATKIAQIARVVSPHDIGDLEIRAKRLIEELCAASDAPVIVQEIGGYCAPLVEGLAARAEFAGVVEDTKQGHWRYVERDPLPCPVLTVADSPLKALEDRQVGRAIGHALETILRRRFYRLASETRVGILGYGRIGEATARSLAESGAEVAVFDICDIRMAEAALAGFATPSRETLLETSDVILGVTGRCSLTATDLGQLRDGTIVASGSSKQVEIDVDGLSRHGRLVDADETAKEYELSGRRVHLLNDGLPINFLEQSVLGRVLDLVYSELYMCVRELALGRRKPGLGRLGEAQQRQIAEIWRNCHWMEPAWTG